jgi:hypothetical protein
MPKGTDRGWELQSSFVSPFLGAVEDPDAPIEFGEFIGAGSFGRVYRGRWVVRWVGAATPHGSCQYVSTALGRRFAVVPFCFTG